MGEFKRSFGLKLKKLRQSLGFNKKEMASFLDMRDVSRYNPYENGKKSPSKALKFRIDPTGFRCRCRSCVNQGIKDEEGSND